VNYRALYDGEVFLSIMINSFIHTIMYTYYFVSSHTKNIWWKKYLTAMQMIQFMTLNVHGFLIMQKKCSSTPYRIIFFYLIYSQTLFWLFMNFFIRSYCCTRPRQTVQDHTTKKIN
jgi:elongation of very long chain fatty acids protein 4